MIKTAFVLTLFATAVASMPAQAQRVFVSGHGLDTNPCTVTQPCRTFQQAFNTVPANGEIDVLDPAGYGQLTITHGISIQAHGFGGISVPSGGAGIAINATAADTVSLHGLLIEGSGVGQTGILFNSGKSLVVDNCVSRNFTSNGLYFVSTATTLQTLAVSDSIFDSSAFNGLLVQAFGSGPIRATVGRSEFRGNASVGLYVVGDGTGTLNVAVTDSIASNGSGGGFVVASAAGGPVTNLLLTRSTAAGNSTGVAAFGTNATFWLAQSTVTGNTTYGYEIAGGVGLSYGDNYIEANAGNSGNLGGAIKQ
jgi:hypothetical protein